MGFWQNVESAINKGVEVSKDALGKAKDKAKELGEKGKLSLEIMQLEKEAEKAYWEMGTQLYDLIEKKQIEIDLEKQTELKHFFNEIKAIKEKIEAKHEMLKKL